MTPAEVILMTRGYLMKRSKEWEQTRVIAFNTYLNRNIKGRHMTNIKEWMPLPSDKFQKLAPKQVDEMRLQWQKFSNKK